MLSSVVERLERAPAVGLDDKLREYNGERTENLIAELRMGEALSIATRAIVHFQAGDAHDFRLRSDTLDCTVEVEHKSSVSAFSAIFYPEPDLLERYRGSAQRWKQAASLLGDVVRASRFEIQPWLTAALSEPSWSFAEREQEELRSAEVAEWLARELVRAPRSHPSKLVHAHAHFDLTPVDEPGRICGAGPLEAFELRTHDDGGGSLSLSSWLRRSVNRKARKAAEHPTRRGAQHLIGLVIDEVYASGGYLLDGVLLGGIIADLGRTPAETRSYRAFPKNARHLLDEATARGRGDMLRAMRFEPCSRVPSPLPLAIDEMVYQNVDGVVALYYTGQLQFIPVPFAAHELGALCEAFPGTLDPFDPSTSVALLDAQTT